MAVGVDVGEAVHVAGIIEDHGHIGALAGQAGSGAPRQNSSTGGPAGSQGGLYVRGVTREDDADGELAVVGGVGGVEGAGTEIETDFAAKVFLEQGFELAMGREAFVVERGLIREDGKR